MTTSRMSVSRVVSTMRYAGSPRPRCLRRCYSTITHDKILSQSQKSHGAVLLRTRRLIELRGAQATQFLQGLTTANITPWRKGQPRIIYSAFLNAQGRLLQDIFIYPIPHSSEAASEEPGFLVDVDADQVGNLMKWLKKYKLRTKVAIREVPPDEGGVLCTWPATDDSDSQDPRAPGFATREAGTTQTLLEKWQSFNTQSSHDVDPQNASMELQYKIRRYTHGIPEGQDELAYEHALIHDSNIDYMGGVDFRKGCYVGQELVIRTQHTGVVRKRVLPCVVYNAHEPTPMEMIYDGSKAFTAPPQGADIKAVSQDAKKTKSKGKWLAGVGNVGLAMCRLEDMVGVGPAGDAVEGWEAKEWALEWEDQSEEDKNLRVKAFIPEWWRERIRSSRSGAAA